MKTIPEEKANLLFNVINRSIPATTYPRQLEHILLEDKPYLPLQARLSFQNSLAIITLNLPLDSKRAYSDWRENDLWNKSLSATTQFGESFEAAYIHIKKQVLVETELHITIESAYWTLGHPQAQLWAGQLETNLPTYFGNLTIQVSTQEINLISYHHLLLPGSVWNYYLIQKDNKRPTDSLIIDTGGQPLDVTVLHRELRALSFCLGFPVISHFFSGVDQLGNWVGNVGGDFGYYRLSKNFTDSPVPNSPSRSWAELFFEQLTRQLAVQNSRSLYLTESIRLYIEASSEVSLVSRTIKLFTACMTVANGYLDSTLLQNAIDADEDKEENDDEQLMGYEDDTYHHPVELISSALHQAGLTFYPELISAIQQSDEIILGFLQQEPYAVSMARCDVLRTLCIGLVASIIGYKGPISIETQLTEAPTRKAYQETDHDLRDWWPYNNEVSLPDRYIAEVKQLIPISDASELWPSFERPTIPNDSLVSRINEFSQNLVSKTGGGVQARLLPLPSFSNEVERLYDFVLESVKYPLANSILFTVRQETSASPLEIINWEEAIDPIVDERSLYDFLKQVAFSSRTRHAVERLLLATSNE